MQAKANPLTLVLWAMELLSDKGRLDVGALTEVELVMAVADYGTEESLHRAWREAVEVVGSLASAEPMPFEVVATRNGQFALSHPAYGLMPATWCLSQSAGFLAATVACQRGEVSEVACV